MEERSKHLRINRSFIKWIKHLIKLCVQVVPVSVNYHFTRQCNYSCGFCFHTAKTSYVLPEKVNAPLQINFNGVLKVFFWASHISVDYTLWVLCFLNSFFRSWTRFRIYANIFETKGLRRVRVLIKCRCFGKYNFFFFLII